MVSNLVCFLLGRIHLKGQFLGSLGVIDSSNKEIGLFQEMTPYLYSRDVASICCTYTSAWSGRFVRAGGRRALTYHGLIINLS